MIGAALGVVGGVYLLYRFMTPGHAACVLGVLYALRACAGGDAFYFVLEILHVCSSVLLYPVLMGYFNDLSHGTVFFLIAVWWAARVLCAMSIAGWTQ